MQEVKCLGVVGAGQMGRGIAQVGIQKGYQVCLYDVAPEGLQAGADFIKKQLLRGVEKNKWDQAHADGSFSKLKLVSNIGDLSCCDFVVEAATENKDIKFKIFKQLDEVCKPEAILATNTSSISISEIAKATNRPGQVVGMHFMNPVPVMKLVEGIRGKETKPEVFELTEELAVKMGKTFVKSNDFPGFIINRILMPMINEAAFAFHDGVASVEDIDLGMKLGTNVPMGPLTLADFIGLDTCLSIMEVLYEGFKDEKYRPCPTLKEYVAAGKLGKKSGEGFYKY